MHNTLETHKRRVHMKFRKIPCDVCQKLVDPYAMKEHKRRHTGEGTIKCPHCDRFCSGPSQLKVHMRTHSTEKNFQCEICSKMFKERFQLNAHKRTHSNDFRNVCKWCGKGFHSKKNFQKHTLTIHGHVWDDASEATDMVGEVN